MDHFEVDVLAGFVLARRQPGCDRLLRGEVGQLERCREWFGRELREMEPSGANRYFGQLLRATTSAARVTRAQAVPVYFECLEPRHKV